MHSEYSKKLFDKQLINNHYSILVLDSQFEALFDSITSLTAKLCHSPVALVTFVEEDSIWIQSQYGFPDVKVIPNNKKFCGIFPQDDDYFEICDTDLDAAHQSHLFHIKHQQAKFYAGARINLPLGEMIGVLCVFDTDPRKLTAIQRNYLIGMADVIEKALVTKHFLRHIS